MTLFTARKSSSKTASITAGDSGGGDGPIAAHETLQFRFFESSRGIMCTVSNIDYHTPILPSYRGFLVQPCVLLPLQSQPEPEWVVSLY